MAIAFVNQDDNYATGFASSLVIPAISHTAGNLLILTVFWQQDGGFPSNISSVSNTAGDTWTPLTKRTWLTNRFAQQFYVASTNGHASDSVTINFDGTFGANQRAASVVQLSGQDANPFDGENFATGSGTNVNTGTISVTADGMIVAEIFNEFGSLGGGSGYTFSEYGSTSVAGFEYKAVTASEAASFTQADAPGARIGSSWKEGGGGATAVKDIIGVGIIAFPR